MTFPMLEKWVASSPPGLVRVLEQEDEAMKHFTPSNELVKCSLKKRSISHGEIFGVECVIFHQQNKIVEIFLKRNNTNEIN